MRILRQFAPLQIDDVTEEALNCFHHSHTYYEMVFVENGSGTHNFNDNLIPYQPGDLFLLCPGDHHYFTHNEPSRLIYLKFTQQYFKSKHHLSPDEYFMGTPESMMKLRWLKEVKIQLQKPQKAILHQIIGSILLYDKEKDISSSPVVFYLLLSVFGLVKEAMHARDVRLNDADPNNEQISSYIHEHIYDRDRLSVKHISDHFNISPTYFSNFFKRNFNISYQNYLNEYRIKLVEKRIETGSLKFKQIAQEFGFTDVSHMSKSFKKQLGLSPTAFRNSRSLADK